MTTFRLRTAALGYLCIIKNSRYINISYSICKTEIEEYLDLFKLKNSDLKNGLHSQENSYSKSLEGKVNDNYNKQIIASKTII